MLIRLVNVLFVILFPVYGLTQTPPEKLYVDDSSFGKSDNLAERIFLISNSAQAASLRVVYSGRRSVYAKLYCENKFIRSLKFHRNSWVDLRIPSQVDRCKLDFNSIQDVELIKDSYYSAIYAKYNDYKEICNYKGQGVFYSNGYSNMSCISTIDTMEMLLDSKESFLKKLEVLLGYKPGLELIDNQDPYAALDFSKAPKLDAIYISTLLYQNDFSGQLMARILKFHAKQGTVVNIIGTEYMHSDSAKKLFKELANYSPNIRVQEYKYYEDNIFDKLNIITNKLRDMHVKVFVTISETDPENNISIIGGRNIHDGFLFQERPNLSSYPELDQMEPDESFAFWQDFEVIVRSRDFARRTYASLLRFWNRDLKNGTMKSIVSRPLPMEEVKLPEDLENVALARMIMSTPFSDDHALEKLYVELIDSAKTSILISSPYLRPTGPIMDAIKRAIQRKGMEITIQTRIDLNGDTQAWLYEETNKAAINDLYDKVNIYEWKESSILHSKLLVIDDDISVIGSVNLSRRSFIQDVENSMIIYSRDFNSKLKVLFQDYRTKSMLIVEEQERKVFASIVVYLLQNQF